MADSDVLVRLRALSDEAFARVVADVAAALHPDASVTVAPPSPAGGVDARVETARSQLLVHVHRPSRSSPSDHVDETDAPGRVDTPDGADVTDLVPVFDADDVQEVVSVATSFDGLVLAVTGPVTDEARTVAEESGVQLLDADDFLALLDRHDVTVPAPESLAERFDRLVDRQAGEWPRQFREVVSSVLAEIENVAAFNHRIVHAEGTTDVDFLPSDRAEAAVRARLDETTFAVYVTDADGRLETVTQLSALDNSDPSESTVLGEVLPAVRDALDRVS